MKLLKNILLSMRQDEQTYKQMYDGKLHILPAEGTKELPINVSEPIYWDNDIYYKIERTNRLEASKPTITIGIPIKRLNIAEGLINGETKVSQNGIPAADYCLRAFKKYIDELNEKYANRKRTDKENGSFYIYKPNGKVLRRNCSYFMQADAKSYDNIGYQSARSSKNQRLEWYLNLMIMVQLPEKKLKQTIQMLTKDLPGAVKKYISDFDLSQMKQAVLLYNQQEDIRAFLKQSEYCAFIADGSILPREKDTDLPMIKAKAFSSGATNRITVCGITGLGIKKGVTVITGGGYSGKSTLLDAISAGIYNHIRGDGREYVITDSSAIKISAEDGRSIRNLNISAFIKWIPGNNTKCFTTDHASGSTSQAANIIEAVNDGSKLLLIDEDNSATNFMIRDDIMKELVMNDPIIPFTDRVQELYKALNISTILVIGGSSEYLKVCDQVIMMKGFIPYDITANARQLTGHIEPNITGNLEEADWICSKKVRLNHFSPYPREILSEHLEISDKGFIEIGDECIDIRHIHNIAGFSQLTAIGLLIRKIGNSINVSENNIRELVEKHIEQLEKGKLDDIYSSYFTSCGRWLELPRKYELLAVIHRMRYI